MKTKKNAQKKRKTMKKGQRVKSTRPALLRLWKLLASGDMIVLVKKNGTITRVRKNIKERWAQAADEPNVIAILTASMSWDGWERLEVSAKGKTSAHVLKEYKKYFTQVDILSNKDWAI